MKFLIKLSFKNVFRNKRRSFLTALAIFFATFLIVIFKSYMNGVFYNMLENVRIIQSGDIKIAHIEYFKKERTMSLEYYIENYRDIIEKLQKIKEIKYILPRIKIPVIININDKNYTISVIGIDTELEKKFNPLNKKIISGKYLDPDKKTVLIGNLCAEKLGINVNNKITLLARTVYNSISIKSFKINGIFSYGTAGIDKKVFFIPLKFAQKLVKMDDGVSEILIILKNYKDAVKIEKIINKNLSQEYVAKSWTKQGNYYELYKLTTSFYNKVYFFFVLLASFVIINTIMMTVYERYKEIGTLTAMGMSKKEVVLLFILEAGILSVIGSLTGSITGGIVSLILSRYGINVGKLSGGTMEQLNISNIIYLKPGINNVIFSFALGIIVTTIFAAIPARKAAKIDPVKALRTV